MPSLIELRSAFSVLFEGMDRAMAWRLVAANLLALASGTLAGLAPVALKQMIDAAGAGATASQAIAWFGAAYLLCLGVGRIVSELRPLLVGAVEQGLYARLRVRYFKHLLDLPLSFHLARPGSALGHHLQQGIAGYQFILSSLVNGMVPILVEALTVVVVLVSLGLSALAATFGMTAIALWLVVGLHMPRMRTAARTVTEVSMQTHGLLADSLANYEPIKCFGAERSTLNNFRELAMALAERWRQLQYRRFLMGAAVASVFTLSVTASLAIAFEGITQGTLSLGGLVLITAYMVQIIRPLELLSSAARDVTHGLAFVSPLLEILGTPAGTSPQRRGADTCCTEEKGRGVEPTKLPQPGVSVSFRHVRLEFDRGAAVLKDLNLDIPAGRSLALVGASGSGKSSLTRLLLRLCEPDEGCIAIDGTDIHALPIDELRSMIAVVPQDVALLNSTIGANIAFGKAGATPAAIDKAAQLAGLQGLLSALPCGYDTVIGERGLKLSGGERQRIAIARAILRDPRLYVFDEATSMLDAHTERMIMENIKAISKGRTVIMIAHRLAAARHADDIAVLSEGRIAEQGSHATLMVRGSLYAALWRDQQAPASA